MAIFGKKGGPSKIGGGGNKFRGFIVVLGVAALLAGFYVYYFHIRNTQGLTSKVELSGAPNVSSVLGEATSPEYLKLIEQENIRRAEEAKKEGKSAIATVVRASYIGPGEFGIPDGTKRGCSVEELKKARAAGVSAAELKCLNCPLEALRAAGYTAGELAAAGYSAEDLKKAGFSAAELKAAGFSAAELKRAGYSITDLKNAGYTASELSQAGYTPDELTFAGFTKSELAEAGIGVNAVKTDCSVESLKRARASGVSAAQLRKGGCGAAALRAAGFTAAELRAAGFSAAELKAAGFSAKELLDAGFTAGELRKAGFTAAQLRAAGLSAEELKAAGFTAAELKAAGFSAAELKAAGFSEGDLLRAGYAHDEVVGHGNVCDVNTLKKIHVDKQLASCTLKTILDSLQCDSKAYNEAGILIPELIGIGFDENALKKAGFSPADIITANGAIGQRCSMDSIKSAKDKKIAVRTQRQGGCSVQSLRNAGYTARDLIDAGACGQELAQGGFTAKEIEDALKPLPVVAAAATPTVSTKNADIDALERAQEARLTAQDREDEINKIQQSMGRNARDMMNNWMPPVQQRFELRDEPKRNAEEGGEERERGLRVGGGVAASGTPKIGGLSGKGSEVPMGPSFPVRAGDVMFAVLDTAVNSDENSPILASIVSGKLKGARLVGTFALVQGVQGSTQGKVVLTFNQLSVPWLSKSVGIQAVAIDPNTARTALAHKVDNHYMQRYGGLFASSFLSGFASAISSSGSQTSSGAGGILTTNAPLSVAQEVAVAVGAVGTAYSKVLGDTFTRPPTVTIEGGTGIGVLFMQDADVKLKE